MGLFDKKKNSAKEEKVEETKSVEAGLQDDTTVEEKNRRFYLVVDAATLMLDGSGVVATGHVYGTVKVSDTVYIIKAGGQTVEAKVVSLQTTVDEKPVVAESSTDAMTQIQLDITDLNVVSQYSVISNIRPQTQADVKTANEHPLVAGLLYAFPKCFKDNKFSSNFTFGLTHGYFITPLKLETLPEDNGDGTATFKQDTKMGFYMFKAPNAKEDQKEGAYVLPIFTDWSEMHKWTALANSEGPVRTMMVNFQNLVEITKNPAFDGFVINPFSKNTLTVTKQLINNIVNMPGYQAEFVKKDGATPNISEETVKKQTQVMLGVPANTPEIENIKTELRKYGELHNEVKSLAFLLKIEENNIQKYLIIVEVDDEIAKNHMQGIYEAIQPFAVSCKNVEFAIKGKINGLDDIVMQHKDEALVYEA